MAEPLDLDAIKARMSETKYGVQTSWAMYLESHAADDLDALIAEVERLRGNTVTVDGIPGRWTAQEYKGEISGEFRIS